MKILVKVKTRAKVDKVERVSQPELALSSICHVDVLAQVIYKVSVKEAPVAGRANTAVIRTLAEYFDITPSRIKILTGQTSKQKLFEIL